MTLSSYSLEAGSVNPPPSGGILDNDLYQGYGVPISAQVFWGMVPLRFLAHQ